MNLLPWYKKQKQGAAPPCLSKHHRKYLEEAGAFAELPKGTTDALLPIYVSVLDDLLPVVDGARILRDYSNGLCSVYLVRAICLVVSKYPQAAPFLRLSEDGPLLEPLQFARRVFSGLDAAVKAGLEPSCVTKIQILVFMHLHNDGTGGQDRSSAYLSQAINQAWAISLHFPIVGNPDQDQNDMLWWSLRNLDRLNKIVMGAGPFMIDDTDIAIKRIVPKHNSYRSQVMGTALILGDLIATATKVYKASLKTTIDDCLTFPTFSELVSGFDFDRFHQSHRKYVEIWYLVAAMLSCRFSGPGSTLYNRRLEAADRVVEMLSHGGHTNLPPLPLVPYSMSMSTTIIYRALRDQQRDLTAAQRDLTVCAQTLDDFCQKWTTVNGIAKLTKRILRVLSGTQGQRQDRDKRPSPAQIQPDIERPTVSKTSNMINQWNSDVASSSEAHMIPFSIPTNRELPFQEEQIVPLSDPNSHREQRPDGPWPASGSSFSQLDRAFNDMFDYRMPNVLRDPTAWEFLPLGTSDEESLSVGNELQISPSYLPGPEQGVGNFNYVGVDCAPQGAWYYDLASASALSG